MTQTPAPQEARTQTRVRIFMFLRPRRILAALGVMLMLATTAAALPGLPAVPGAPALPDLPATPDLPAVDQDVGTPVGSASAHAANGQVELCADAAADTGMLPQAPALPATPVPLPVAAPALPDTSAGAAADLCAYANAQDLTASAKAGASAYGAGMKGDFTADADQGHASGKADVEASTGIIDDIVAWFQSLF